MLHVEPGDLAGASPVLQMISNAMSTPVMDLSLT